MDLQKLVDAMNEASRETRGSYHLTLGQMISALEAMPVEAPVAFDDGLFPTEPHSYRGYYSDLAFERSTAPVTAGSLLETCRDALGETFDGYKGGDFKMQSSTPLWASDYGSTSGLGIMGITDNGDGTATIRTQQID